MQTPPRIVPTRSLLLRGGGFRDTWSRPRNPGGEVVRVLRALRRSLLLLLWCLAAMAPQAVLILLPGYPKVWFARIFWLVFCRIFGAQIRMIGAPRRETGGRAVVFVANHASWLDVPVLGACLPACFVAKDAVSNWPLVNIVARLGRTVYVSRQRQSTRRERDSMRERLAAGDNLILFPEGTTSDGSRVLPFRSSLLAVAEGDPAPLIQPVSVVYDRLAGLPACRSMRPLFAYYGDMTLGPHFWQLAQWSGIRATVLLHPPMDPCLYPDRKALSLAVWQKVADGAAILRQNRQPGPAQISAHISG